MIDKLNKLISVLEGGEGIDRFERRVERESFKQWLSKFKDTLRLYVEPTPIDPHEVAELVSEDADEENVEGTHDDPQVGTT